VNGKCGICGDEGEVFYLPIYVIGSEGITVCLQCRIDIGDFIRSMMRVGQSRRMEGAAMGRAMERRRRDVTP